VQDSGGALRLTCGGAGAATKVETARAFGGDSNGNTGWATLQHRGSQDFEDQVDLIIDGENSRIRLPRVMLPPIHGGDGGWFKLKGVRVEPTHITGSAAINVINSPKVFVDRQTGRISIDGKAGHYSGQCERAAAADQPTKF
jgi:hypothetical protein